MKTSMNQHSSDVASLFAKLVKSFVSLFESGEKKEFERLKNFITS